MMQVRKPIDFSAEVPTNSFVVLSAMVVCANAME